nr:septum formation family protein [Schumannella luteola]
MKVGDCFLEPDEDYETEIVDCTELHDYEVTALPTLDGTDYPGDIKVDKVSRALCSQALTDYVGIPYADSSLDSWAWTPDEDGWDAGDHVAICTANDYYYDGLDQSVKDAKI